MNLISVSWASKAYGPRVLLSDVSLGISAGDRIGVVGRNGAGKSTLLALLAGTTEPDTGRIARMSGLRAGYLPQGDDLTGTVGQIVFGREREAGAGPWEADPLARAVAGELLPGIGLGTRAEELSGGERRRVALAALLTAGRDLLLLDEPTNHLDIEAIDWLGRHLRGRGCAVVVVSHDRWLLDTVCERTWEVAAGRVHAADGGYSAYVLAEAERRRSADAAEQRRLNLARKELAWLRRGPQARSSKPRFRVQAANALIAAEPPARDGVELTRMATARLGKTVIELEDVTLRVGPEGAPEGAPEGGRVLLDHVTWRLGPGERVGLAGVNGAGKTSLLRLLAGEPVPGMHAEGRILRGKTVRVGHLSQDLAELDPGLRVREAAEEVRMQIQVGKRELSAGQLLERLGFRGERQWTPVGELSGGERRRLAMLRLLMDEPNVLLLDEPTNDLDIETLTEFEDLLDGWPGTLVVVSHDRYFLERATDHVVALPGDGSLAFLGGGVDEYLERVRALRAARAPAAGNGPAQGEPASAAARERAARKELQRLERQLDRVSSREDELTAELAANATDYEKLTALGAELRAVQAEKSDLEERWLTVAGTLLTPGGSPRGRPSRTPRPAAVLAVTSHDRKGRRPFADVRSRKVSRDGGSLRATRRGGGRGGGRGVEGGQQGAQEVREPLTLPGVKAREQRVLAAEQVGQGRVHAGAALAGQRHQDAAPVPRVRFPAYQARLRQPVDPVGHGSRGHERRAEQRTGGQLEGRPVPAQRGQHIELPRLKPVGGERAAPGDVQMLGEPGDPAQYVQRRDVEVGPLRLPRCHEPVHLVAERRPGILLHRLRISLDVKMLDGVGMGDKWSQNERKGVRYVGRSSVRQVR